MSQLTWSPVGASVFQHGLDRGVLYIGDDPGIAWSGLISVDVSMTGNERIRSYFDGIELLEIVKPGNFQATIKAFSSPAEFDECLGEKSFMPGFSLTHQLRVPFGLSYRTFVGDGSYKIHIIYNATVASSSRANQTVGKQINPLVYQWELDALPEEDVLFEQCIPTAHLVIDSNKVAPEGLASVESMLYGAGTDEEPISSPMLLAPNLIWTALLGPII